MEEKLIELVRQNEFIYNKKNRHNKNMPMREKKFEEFSIKLNIPAKKLKERWRTLKDKFQREIKKESQSSGSRSISPKKGWKWMDQLMFLNEVDSANKNTSSNFAKDCVLCSPSLEETIASISSHSEYPSPAASTENLYANDVMEDNARISTPLKEKKKRDTVEIMLKQAKEDISSLITLTREALVAAEPKKSLAQLFFEGLAMQTDEANLSNHQFARLQMQMLKTFNSFMYESTTRTHTPRVKGELL